MSDIEGNPLAVVPDEVSAVGRYAYRVAAELRDGAQILNSEVSAVLTSWRGPAAQSYAAGWQEMHGGAMQVWTELLELAEKLGVTAENYRVQEATSTSLLNVDPS